MKSSSYIMVAIILTFVTLGILFNQFLKTEIYTNRMCRHLDKKTATLWHQPDGGNYYCYWRVEGQRQLSATWDDCGDLTDGQEVTWYDPDSSCEHLDEIISSGSFPASSQRTWEESGN